MGSDHEWRRSYSFPLTKNEAQKSDVQPGFSSDAESFEETVSIVKGRVWSFREALKGVAEALVGYGLSPSVVGYSTVAIHEEGYVAEKNDGAAALQSVTDSEHEHARSKSLPRGAEEFVPRSNPGEDSSLLHQVDDEEEDNHAFAESIRRDRDERKSLTRPGSWQFRNALEEDDDSK